MTLKELVDSEPTNAAKTDAEVLAWCNTPSIDTQTTVSKSQLLQWAGVNERLANVRNGAASHASAAIKNVCDVALLLLTAPDVPTFDTGDAANVALLDALVAGAVLSAQDKTDLMVLGYEQLTPASNAGLGNVRMGQVEEVE